MRLRTKILFPFVVIGVVLILFLYGYWMPRHVVDLEREYRQATERHLVSVVEGLIPLMLAHQLDAVYENLDTLRDRNPNWLSIRVLDADGREIYPLTSLPARALSEHVHPMEQTMRYQDKDLGRLIVDVDFEEPLRDLHVRHRELAVSTTVILLLSIGALWSVIERMVSRPVANLAQASKRIAEGDFNASLPQTGRDEVGELVRNFDQMRAAVSRFQAELISRNRSLIKLSHAVEQSPAAIVITDQAGTIEFVNPRFNEVMGCAPGEMTARNIRQLRLEDASNQDFETVWGAVRGGAVWRGEFRSSRKNGELLWLSASVTAVLNEAGEMTNTVAVLEDISERRALEEQLRHAQKMEAVGLLTGGIAHDFNNILAAIIGYGSVIGMKMPPDDPLRAPLGEILNAAERAAGLVRSLLAFSKKQIVNPQAVDVNALVARLKGMLFRLIREDIEFITVLQNAPLAVFIDPGQLEQVLINLVTNARDAMPDGGTLIIETERTTLTEQFQRKHGEAAGGPHVMISVSDTGIGMDAKTQEHMYEPFFTTKDQGKGTGLGLATVYGIVKQNSGQISCYSVPGRGTTFKIYFPLIEAPEMRTDAVPLPELQRGSETILVAEDNETVRDYTQSILREAGYTVLTAVDGEDAVARFQERPEAVDLLLLDVIMPKKNGREVYEAVRLVRPEIRVLFTSGYTADLLAQKGIIDGGFPVLSKPSTPYDLLRKVREVLGVPLAATGQ